MLLPLLEPTRIHDIVVRDTINFPGTEFGADILYFFCGHAGKDTSGGYSCAFGDDRPCRNDTVAFDYAIVHHDATHADQHIVLYRTAVNDGIMADGDIITNIGRGFLIGAMDHGAILHIDLVAHFYIMDITPYHRIEPNTALVAHTYLADKGRIFGDEAVVADFWGFSVNFFDHFC